MVSARQARVLSPEDWAERIRREFVALPGLRLTMAQASRILGLEPGLCRQVLDRLVARQFLSAQPDGTYLRLDQLPARAAGADAHATPFRVA
jgi:hypothetical protein